jgi:hypothetical protein
MSNWSFLELMVFAIGLLWAMGSNIPLRRHYGMSNKPVVVASAIAMTQMVSVIATVIFLYSPFHLVWLFLASYVAGFLSLRIKMLGRIAWFYGYMVYCTIPANWRNKSGVEDGTDYINQSEQSASEEKEAIRRIWSRFEGKPDNASVLRAKASILALVLSQTISEHTEGFVELGNVGEGSSGDVRKQERFISLGECFVEIASVYLSFIDRFVSSALNEENRTVFMDALHKEFITRALLEHYRENADMMEDAFVSDLNKRLEAYARLDFYAGEGDRKDTVLYNFAKIIGKIVGKEKNALFNAIIIHTILRDIDILQLAKLLPNEK